jgi:hypothetical protein
MRNLGGSRVILAGVAGILLGSAAEALVNRYAAATVITDGMLWGAVLGVLVASLPNFTRMGSLAVHSDKSAINFVVGIGMFILISLVIVTLFLGVFSLFGRLLP